MVVLSVYYETFLMFRFQTTTTHSFNKYLLSVYYVSGTENMRWKRPNSLLQGANNLVFWNKLINHYNIVGTNRETWKMLQNLPNFRPEFPIASRTYLGRHTTGSLNEMCWKPNLRFSLAPNSQARSSLCSVIPERINRSLWPYPQALSVLVMLSPFPQKSCWL